MPSLHQYREVVSTVRLDQISYYEYYAYIVFGYNNQLYVIKQPSEFTYIFKYGSNDFRYYYIISSINYFIIYVSWAYVFHPSEKKHSQLSDPKCQFRFKKIKIYHHIAFGNVRDLGCVTGEW